MKFGTASLFLITFISPNFFSYFSILFSRAFKNVFACIGEITILDLTFDLFNPGKILIKSRTNSAAEWVTIAKLTYSNLTYANLTTATLTNATLTNANFTDATLTVAKLQNAKFCYEIDKSRKI